MRSSAGEMAIPLGGRAAGLPLGSLPSRVSAEASPALAPEVGWGSDPGKANRSVTIGLGGSAPAARTRRAMPPITHNARPRRLIISGSKLIEAPGVGE